MPPAGLTGQDSAWPITTVEARHEAELRRMLLGLDRRSRIVRFGLPVSDDHLVGHLASAMSDCAMIAAAFVGAHARGLVEVYAAAHLGFAEAAFVVDTAWRGRGIGTALLDHAVSGRPPAAISSCAWCSRATTGRCGAWRPM
jgi:GNAT superfamily N-acetyltransferase